MDVIISATDDMITMIEGFAREVPEDEMLDALVFGHDICREVIGLMRELSEKAKVEKAPFEEPADNGILQNLITPSMNDVKTAIHDLEEKVIRDSILGGVRSDGRDAKTLRAIECHTNVIPRVHGSSIFQRGETQAMITITLGTGRVVVTSSESMV